MRTFTKEAAPADSLDTHPWTALEEAWDDEDPREFIFHEIQNWFPMALCCEAGAYEDITLPERENFAEFFADLLQLLEIAYCCRLKHLFITKNNRLPDLKEIYQTSDYHHGYPYTFVFLREEELEQPLLVIKPFCVKYPIAYARRELWDLFSSAFRYEGPLRDRVTIPDFPVYFEKLLTIVEACYRIATTVDHHYIGV